MRRTWLTLTVALAACAALLAGPVCAQTAAGVDRANPNLNNSFYPDFAANVQAVNADASPGADASQVNNYINQDEQVNVTTADGVVRVLRTDQKNLVQSFVTKVVEVKNVKPAEIVTPIQTVVGKEGGRAEVIIDKVKKKAWIQYVCPEWQAAPVEQAIKALDEGWVQHSTDGAQDVYYKAKFRDPALVDRLAQIWGGTVGFSEVDANNGAIHRNDEPYRMSEYLKAAKQVDIPEHQIMLEGAIYELNTSNDLKLGLDYIAWKNGPGRNLFDFLLAGESNRENFKNASSYLNPRGRFVDTDGDDDRNHFHLDNRQEYFQVNFLLTAAYLDFLQSKGKAKVLARPTVSTRSGTVGTWTSVDQVVAQISGPDPGPTGSVPQRIPQLWYPQDAGHENNDNGGPTTGDNKSPNNISGNGPAGLLPPNFPLYGFLGEANGGANLYGGFGLLGDQSVSNRTLRYQNAGQTGLFLSILPFIGTETTELAINFSSADLSGTTPQGTPISNTRTYLTSVRVADGQPFIVAGVRRSDKVKTQAGAPWLSALPVMGWLFGGEQKIDHQADIAMVLTPSIFLGGEADLEMPAAAKTTVAQANGTEPTLLPKNSFGFDQWLLDKEKN